MNEFTEYTKAMVDGISFAAVLGTLWGLLPHATAAVTFVYVCVRLYSALVNEGFITPRHNRRKDDDHG